MKKNEIDPKLEQKFTDFLRELHNPHRAKRIIRHEIRENTLMKKGMKYHQAHLKAGYKDV